MRRQTDSQTDTETEERERERERGRGTQRVDTDSTAESRSDISGGSGTLPLRYTGLRSRFFHAHVYMRLMFVGSLESKARQ